MKPQAPFRRDHSMRIGLLLVALCALSGCASLVSNAASGFADNLGAAVLNQDDPATVRDGAPAYLLLLDSLLEGNPDDPDILAAAAQLYASYGAIFADDAGRAGRLTDRARNYAGRGLCISFAPSCDWDKQDFAAYEASLTRLKPKHADYVLAYGVASLAWIRAHSADWNALAELPHMEALLKRYLDIGERSDAGAVYTYLGILATLRPPALGGQPEQGRAYFEQAVALSEGRDLSVKVEFARGYARLLYDRELHDALLTEVLAADPHVAGYTLTNVLAQRDAEALIASADDYF
ncbi:MAG: TRAP transporter TatT component family protein [Woeseia sp.]